MPMISHGDSRPISKEHWNELRDIALDTVRQACGETLDPKDFQIETYPEEQGDPNFQIIMFALRRAYELGRVSVVQQNKALIPHPNDPVVAPNMIVWEPYTEMPTGDVVSLRFTRWDTTDPQTGDPLYQVAVFYKDHWRLFVFKAQDPFHSSFEKVKHREVWMRTLSINQEFYTKAFSEGQFCIGAWDDLIIRELDDTLPPEPTSRS